MYKTRIVPLKCNKTDYEYMLTLNKISADVWNYCIQIDEENRKKTKKDLTLSELEFETKQKFLLHAKGVHHIVFKYYYARNNMWKSRKANHKNSRKVELPYKEKRFLPTGWDIQALTCNYDKNQIRLTCIKGRGRITCFVKSIPLNVVEIELIHKDKYYLAIKYKEEIDEKTIISGNNASIDLGEIHAVASINSIGGAIIITNRKIRSLVRLKDKRKAEILSLRSNCKKGSNKYFVYTKAISKIKFEFDKKINDVIHKQSKIYANWCKDNSIQTVYYGDLDSATRNSNGRLRKSTNQKLNMWRFGQIKNHLTYKLASEGISMIKINEAYTSQICPHCNRKNKTATRNYACRCGYSQHRDIVGAINILNNNSASHMESYNKKEYLQIR